MQVSDVCTLKVTWTNNNTNITNSQSHDLGMKELNDDNKEDDDTAKKSRTPTQLKFVSDIK